MVQSEVKVITNKHKSGIRNSASNHRRFSYFWGDMKHVVLLSKYWGTCPLIPRNRRRCVALCACLCPSKDWRTTNRKLM